MTNVVIIGAGVSGLSIAYRLQERLPQAAIAVLERDSRPGGTAWTLHEGGFQVEIGPNGFLDTKPTTLELCRDLGLGERLIRATAAAAQKRYLFLGDRLRLLPGGLASLIATDLLSWRGKLGLLTERFRKRRAPKPGDTERDESIAAFARRRAGAEAANLLADALVTGIYAGDPALLSLPACFPRVAALERQHGSVLKGMAAAARERRAAAQANGQPYERPGAMWSVREGLRGLSEALAGALKRPPLYGVAVRGLRTAAGSSSPSWTVLGDGQQSWTADAVVLACPAHQQAALLADVDAELAERIGQIPYNRIAVVALGYRRQDVSTPLDGFGFIAPQGLRRDVLGVQWCSSIYPGRAPPGAVLLRAMCGGWHRAEMVGWGDDRLVQALRGELRRAMYITAAPIFVKIVRWDRAIPQYHVGHLDRVAWIEKRLQRHPRLFLGGNAYHGVALNDCTEQGCVVAARIARTLVERNANLR
ncbi:MAG: protoporphyrinogen oxidase [Gemmataceae bacterium]|nr:protoporphyrinogen oxidase [Gemmataceae bacterium]